jgi:uncharacterized protein
MTSNATTITTALQLQIAKQIATELNVNPTQIVAAVQLLDNGDTVPFISRYRKEVTGGLSDTDLRNLEERLHYLRELEERRATILKSIEEQGKLTPELADAIQNADSKARLEDLYLPYKPKRRTKAQIAREAGLQPLADALLADPSLDPHKAATDYINTEHNIADTTAALEGARFILMEQFSEQADLVGKLRDKLWEEGQLTSTLIAGKEETGQKFKDYFDYTEQLKKVPSHRILAVLRGRQEEILQIAIACDSTAYEQIIAAHFKLQDLKRPADAWLLETARWTWKVKLFIQLEVELMARLREQAEEQAIQVFATNLRDLLMHAPAGPRTILGLDPGLRTGVKVAIVNNTGLVVQHGTIFPHAPKNQWEQSIQILAELCRLHKVELISIGNGTASRETDQLVLELIIKHPELKLQKIVVSEAGASVYSASELAAQEFPDLDVTIRGAVSIARRLQDPLAELVKIDPKAIGVGQYQHDVSQTKLARSLESVVEDCVNAVGVDVNTASVPLLARVAGLNSTIAKNMVAFRDEHGAFKNRKDLVNIPRLGAKTYEQAAGFLRIMSGDNPLDASAVHPEAYPVVERILEKTKTNIREVIGNKAFLKSIKPNDYIDEKFGLPTVIDIIQELEKPGRDPRPEFKTASFKQDVQTLEQVKAGMILEGVVTNVANFGAFIDIGVHQDGLAHISALSNKFIQNPRDVVKAGDIVTVKVLEVDVKRKRISLTLRLEDEIPQNSSDKSNSSTANSAKSSNPSTDSKSSHYSSGSRSSTRSSEKPTAANHTQSSPPARSLFGDALEKALKK